MKVRDLLPYIVLLATTAVYGCSITRSPAMVKKSTLILKEGEPLSQQMTHENFVYVINSDLDLEGNIAIIPKNCTLKFKRGSVRNGTLVGNDTYVELKRRSTVFKDVMLKGSFKAAEFPINAYRSNRLECFYGFIQAFSGTALYLTDDYSVMTFDGESDCTSPSSIQIDGRGHKLTLYSFGAYRVKQVNIKNITIDCRHNIDPKNKWKSDRFTFGIVGSFESSIMTLTNISFSKETGFSYIRGFKSLEISQCKEDGCYFFVYDCNEVSFHHNRIVNAEKGYCSIGRMTDEGHVKIYDNTFKNIFGGGAILTGGLKYNVSIINNLFVRVGKGGATESCVNIHPRGNIIVRDNRILANKGASTLDIDAASDNYFSDETRVSIDNNEIESVEGDASLHGMALVGIARLYIKNNSLKNQHFYFWDTPYMEFTGNTMEFSEGFDNSTEIGWMSTHKTTERKDYIHVFKNNVFNIPNSKGTMHFRYLSKVPVKVTGEGNRHSEQVEFMDQNKKLRISGDVKIYKNQSN